MDNIGTEYIEVAAKTLAASRGEGWNWKDYLDDAEAMLTAVTPMIRNEQVCEITSLLRGGIDGFSYIGLADEIYKRYVSDYEGDINKFVGVLDRVN